MDSLEPGDLNLERLQQLGNLQVYDRSSDMEIIERLLHAGHRCRQ